MNSSESFTEEEEEAYETEYNEAQATAYAEWNRAKHGRKSQSMIDDEIRQVASSDEPYVGELSPEAYSQVYDHYCPLMPYGTAKARDGDPDEWMDQYFGEEFGTDKPASA